MLTTKNSIASIMAAKHPARNSNAVDAGTVAAQTTVIYQGEYRILDNCATAIPWVMQDYPAVYDESEPPELVTAAYSARTYKPETLDQVTELEYQVTQGRVTKTTV
jgi:hypothetical protein